MIEGIHDMKISRLAALIDEDWKKVNFAARPYLDAMYSLEHIKDMYYYDTGESVVVYFLSNAQSWRGETAREVKKELKRRLKLARMTDG